MTKARHPRQWTENITIIALLFIGFSLAIVRVILGLFPFNILLEAIVYFGFGYLLGGKVNGRRWGWGFLLAGPAMAFSLFLLSKLSGQALLGPRGLHHLASIVLLPLVSCLGMYLRIKRKHKIEIIDDAILE